MRHFINDLLEIIDDSYFTQDCPNFDTVFIFDTYSAFLCNAHFNSR